HDPHVDSVLPHQRREDRMHALVEPLLLDLCLLAEGAERARGTSCLLRSHRAGRYEQGKEDRKARWPEADHDREGWLVRIGGSGRWRRRCAALLSMTTA